MVGNPPKVVGYLTMCREIQPLPLVALDEVVIWYELILKNNERFDTFILFEDQLNVSLKSDCKYFRTYFHTKMVKKIFV